MKKITGVLSLVILVNCCLSAQPFTRADTLRGSNGAARSWWDATKYDLNVKFNIPDSSISGYNNITFKVLEKGSVMQIDLQQPMVVDSVLFFEKSDAKGEKVKYNREGNVFFVRLPAKSIQLGAESRVMVYYHGKPKVARRAPWDGGIIWKKDKAGNPFVSIACQGLGASVWYPCKDYQGDEPESAEMSFTAPEDLVVVSNGRLKNKTDNAGGMSTYTWEVVNPINTYNIIPYIGKYVHWGETYKGEKGDLDMDYWVIDSNLTKAKSQFKDAVRMMEAFEFWFGPYPFYEDGFKLVEAPHLGMEHQSGIAYGNGYKNGYLGRDLSGSGQGLKWDFIIIHEAGHEWFGNNITTKDVADMWVHEGFTNYSETLFTEYFYGKDAATEYVTGIRKGIQNDKPVTGHYGVQKEGSGDMYNKASNMIHTIRQVINNDTTFRQILRGLNQDFYHQTVTGKQVQDYINQKSGMDFTKVFDQYLTTIQIPVLEYKNEKGSILYRWTNCIDGFNMPVKIKNEKGKWEFINPTTQFKKAPKSIKEITVDKNFYVEVLKK